MVEVEAGLAETGPWWSLGCSHLYANGIRAVPGKMPTLCGLEGRPRGHRSERHIPGSQNAWGPCSRRHTVHGSSQWVTGLCTGHSHWYRWCQSLLVKGQDEALGTRSSAPWPSGRHLPNKSSHYSQPSSCPSPTPRHQGSLRLTDLTVFRTLTPTVIVFAG